MVDAKVEMCNVLSDIAVAQDMLDTKQKKQEEAKPDLPPTLQMRSMPVSWLTWKLYKQILRNTKSSISTARQGPVC